jgi:hypothetical protein
MEEMLCRNALIRGIPPFLGMCSQLVGEGGPAGGEGARSEAAAADVDVDASEDACESRGGGDGGGDGEGAGAGTGVCAGARENFLVTVGDGLRSGVVSIARSSGRVSMGIRAIRVRVWRRGCCGAERMNRDRGGGPGSKSAKGGGRSANELNDGAKSRGEWKEVFPVLGVGGEPDRM